MAYTTTSSIISPNYITYVCVSTPNLDKLKKNFDLILPHVDRAVIVIGRKDEEAEQYLAQFPQVTVVYRAWSDSFRDQ